MGRVEQLGLDRAAEGAVCGSMMQDPRCVPAVLERIGAEDFAFPELRAVFEAVLRVWHGSDGLVDGVLVRGDLESRGELDGIGGLAFLGAVIESVPSAASAAYYADRVAERARYRRTVSAVCSMRSRLDEGGAADDVVQDVQDIAMGLERGSRASCVYHTEDHATKYAVETQDDSKVVPTGFRNLDALAGGLCPGELGYVAARPSMGKSALMGCWALRAAQSGQRVVIFSLEMTARALMERFSAVLGKVPLTPVKRRTASEDQLDRFYAGSIELAKLAITVVEGTNTAERIAAVLRQLHQARPVGLVMIDYVQLMEANGRNRNEQVSEISRRLKLLAQSVGVPIVALSQLNRSPEGRQGHRPQMGDLRDSGSLEQDADMLLMLHREDYYRRTKDPGTKDLDGLAEVIVAKARNGPTGVAKLLFIEDQMRFEDLTGCDEP